MRAMFRRIELKMKRYISIILGILTSLSISAANFPTEGFSGDGYGDFNVEDYGSDEVGADVPFDPSYDPEVVTITVTLSNGETMTLEDVMVYSDQAYNEGDIVRGSLQGDLTLAAVVREKRDGVDVTYSYPGYLFAVNPDGTLAVGGAGMIFKMPLEENLAVALMLIMMAAAYGVFRLRRKRVQLA